MVSLLPMWVAPVFCLWASGKLQVVRVFLFLFYVQRHHDLEE